MVVLSGCFATGRSAAHEELASRLKMAPNAAARLLVFMGGTSKGLLMPKL